MKKYVLIANLLIFSVAVLAQIKTPAAKQILDAAYKQATAQNKKIFLMFHASWCGWCHKMDSSINNPLVKKFFTDNYILTHLVVNESHNNKSLENKGADALLKQYKAFEKGIPFWVILDKDGKLLKDSFMKNADGTTGIIGCPASEKEVTAFITVLEATSSMKENELELIKIVFRQNEAH